MTKLIIFNFNVALQRLDEFLVSASPILMNKQKTKYHGNLTYLISWDLNKGHKLESIGKRIGEDR